MAHRRSASRLTGDHAADEPVHRADLKWAGDVSGGDPQVAVPVPEFAGEGMQRAGTDVGFGLAKLAINSARQCGMIAGSVPMGPLSVTGAGLFEIKAWLACGMLT